MVFECGTGQWSNFLELRRLTTFNDDVVGYLFLVNFIIALVCRVALLRILLKGS